MNTTKPFLVKRRNNPISPTYEAMRVGSFPNTDICQWLNRASIYCDINFIASIEDDEIHLNFHGDTFTLIVEPGTWIVFSVLDEKIETMRDYDFNSTYLILEEEPINEEPMTSFEELESLVKQWAEDRKIIPNSSTQAQFLKTISEVGELADALGKKQPYAVKDAVGDILVCLINLCALHNPQFSLTECLESAYNEIKDRKGTLTPEGIFVKE